MAIINLTQHAATDEQLAHGVFDLLGSNLAYIKKLLTFSAAPTAEELASVAVKIAAIAAESSARSAMIGGAPYLMAPLEIALRLRHIQPLYSFSERCSVETTLPDGSIQKTAVFRHAGWVKA